MPIDTREKLFSMMNAVSFSGVHVVPLIDPDGAIDQGDRQHLLDFYSGILFGAATPPTSGPYYFLTLAGQFDMGLQKNVASQKWRVFAFNRTNNQPVTGDAANITAKIGLDFAAAGATNDVNPTEVEDGYYDFDLTQAETNANVIDLLPESGTADVQVIGVPARIFTVPSAFADNPMRGTDGAALATVATEARLAELDAANLPTDIDAILADTADIQPKIGAPAATVSADIAAVKAETALIVADTNELQTDWADAGRLDTILDARASQASVDALNNISAADVWAAGTRTLTGAAGITSTGNAIGLHTDDRVIIAGTTHTGAVIPTVSVNSDMRGTDNAFLAVSAPTNFSDLAVTAGTGQVTVGTNNDKTGYSISGTKTTLDALNDVTAAGVWDLTDAIETGWTPRQSMRVIAAALGGKLSGAATTTVTVRSITDAKDRITATVDADGNRSAVTLDGA